MFAKLTCTVILLKHQVIAHDIYLNAHEVECILSRRTPLLIQCALVVYLPTYIASLAEAAHCHSKGKMREKGLNIVYNRRLIQ